MKGLPIFQIYLNTENKFQGTLLEYENPKVIITQMSLLNSIYVNSLHDKRGQNLSPHA